jgi:hypothetical protein
MLTQCPHCGQTHELHNGDQQDSCPPSRPTEGMTASPSPQMTFLLDSEESSGCLEQSASDPQLGESPTEEAPIPIPWEERSNPLDFMAYWQTTRGILFHPAQSFARWSPPKDMEGALWFLVIFGSLGQILANYWIRLIQAGAADSAAPADGWIGFGLFILQAPFLALIWTFLVGLITHFFLFLLRGTSQPWTRTFAFFAYVSGSLALLQPIPFVGLAIAPFWGLAVSVCGLRELHKTTTWRVLAAFLLPLALLMTLLFFLALLIVGAGVLMLSSLPWP